MPERVLLDVDALRRRLGLRRARVSARQPRRAAAGLLGGPRGRRGLPAAVPRPRTGTDLPDVVAAHATTAGPGRRTPALLLHGARRGLPPVPGVAAPGRDAGRRRRSGAQRARRALRAAAGGEPQRRRRPDRSREPRHHARSGRVDASDRRRRRLGRSAAAGVASSTAPSTCACPTAREALLLVTNDGAVEYRLARCPVPRGAHQDHAAWTPVLPEDPAERLEDADAFAAHVVLTLRAGRRAPAAGAAPRRPRRRTSRVPRGRSGRGHPRRGDASGVGGQRRSTTVEEFDRPGRRPTSTPGRPVRTSTSRPASGDRAAPRRRRRATTRRGTPASASPRPRGTARPSRPRWCATVDTPLDGTAPALLYGYGAYEAAYEPDWDPALPSLLDRGVVCVHAHVRGGGEGGRRWWLDGRLGTSRTRSTTTSPSPTASRPRARRRRPDRHPRALARAGCCRARCSASAPTAGGPSWPRCPSSTSSRRCSTPASR